VKIQYLSSSLASSRLLFIFQTIPMGFSPFAIHSKTAGCPFSEVWFLAFISKCGGA